MFQYGLFLSKENFRLAFERLKTAGKTLYKTLYYEDLKSFELFLEENIENLLIQIKEGIYKPEKCHKIFIPKKDNLVRPLSLLSFIDLLVFQAIANTIADFSHDTIGPFYNKIIFGNVINISQASSIDKKFFFKPWKRRWKRFNEISKQYYNEGYKYLSEFDIASFFDTIDHNILSQLLLRFYKIDKEIVDFLAFCLEVWTGDSNHLTFNSKHGIPQGPISSPFLADLYLFYLDSEIIRIRTLDFKYVRYVDDIRILAKDEITAQKLIAALDLLSRDLGLIPQGSKILIKEVTDIDKELKAQNNKFSEIAKEFNEENEGKVAGKLKSKTQKRLKCRFLNCFNKVSDEIYLDKSLISFSLFKLNADEEIKKFLLLNYKLILTHFEGVLFYFKRHFSQDPEILYFVKQIINDENILFHYLIAVTFKYFPNLPFDENVFNRYTVVKHRHWLVNYYIIGWLHCNNKKEIILTDNNSTNYFIQRELNSYKYLSSSDSIHKKIFATRLLEDKNPLIALQGLNLLFNNPASLVGFKVANTYNDYVKFIFTSHPSDIINYTLKSEWEIESPETFFNKTIWSDDFVYEELRSSFLVFIKSIDIDASKGLLNLNAVNNLIFDKVCERLAIQKKSPQYGDNLNANYIEEVLPLCNQFWTEINEKRNQKTEAHPYDKSGNIRLKITNKEFAELIEKKKKL
jgi:hypothetical protein